MSTYYRHRIIIEDINKHWVGNIQQALEYFITGYDACDRGPENRAQCGYVEIDPEELDEAENLGQHLDLHPNDEHNCYRSVCDGSDNSLEFHSTYLDLEMDKLFDKRVRQFCSLVKNTPKILEIRHEKFVTKRAKYPRS